MQAEEDKTLPYFRSLMPKRMALASAIRIAIISSIQPRTGIVSGTMSVGITK